MNRDRFGRSFARDASKLWPRPRQAHVLNPDAFGCSYNVGGWCLRWTFNAGGTISVEVDATTAAELNPNQGCGIILPWHDETGEPILQAPTAWSANTDIITAPPGASNIAVCQGLSNDDALASFIWTGMKWSAASPVAVAGFDGLANASGGRSGIGRFTGSSNFRSSSTGADSAAGVAQVGMNNTSNDDYNTGTTKTVTADFTGQTYWMIGLFPLGPGAAQTVVIDPRALMTPLAPGVRF